MGEIEEKYLRWFQGMDTGISSETIFATLLNFPIQRYGTPSDIADIGLCVKLLRMFPELKKRLGEIRDKYKTWWPYIDCWQELEKLYDECIVWEALSKDEQKRQKRHKYFRTPNEKAWELMEKCNFTSNYFSGLRPQGTDRSWTREAFNKF